MDNFTYPTTFGKIPIGGEFVEVLTTCNQVATRIKPTMHQGKPVNARRADGKFILMADWEPVFVDPSPLWVYYLRSVSTDSFFWQDWPCDFCGGSITENDVFKQTSYKRMVEVASGNLVWSPYFGQTRYGHKQCLLAARLEK